MSAAITYSKPVEHSVNGRDFSVSEATIDSFVVARVLYDYDVDELRVQMRIAGAEWTKPLPRKRVSAFIQYRAPKVIERLTK